MDCPQCGLASPPESLRCDCGYDFRFRRPGGGQPGVPLTKSETILWIILIICVPLVGPLAGLSYSMYKLAKGKRDAGMMLMASIMVLVVNVLFLTIAISK